MNHQFKTLLIDTLKKELRNKTLFIALAFSTMSIFIGYSISKLFMSNGVQANELSSTIVINLVFTYLNLWALLVSVFFGVSAMRSDFQDKIIYQYLSFPISRTMYFFVRLLGTWIIVYGFYLYSYVLTYILFHSLDKSVVPTGGQILSILLMGIYTYLYVLITFLISLFLERLGAFVATIFFAIMISISNGMFNGVPFNEYFKDFSAFKLVGLIFYWIFPRMAVLSDMASSILKGIKSDMNYPLEVVHLIVTSSILVFVINKMIQRKDF